MKGRFLDGCVTGLDYCTRTHQGVVDEQGFFEYEVGETVSFSIGDLAIGSSMAKA